MKVEFKDVYKRYGKVVAVEKLNLVIESGALHFLLGPSGCGKTTTLRMLAGLEEVSEGQLLFDGKDVTHLPAAERGIGMVFQNYALWPHMTVQKNIEYGLNLRKLSPEIKRKRVTEVLGITQLTTFKDRLPGQLSGGQQQRVALARALAIEPSVLLLDEPLSNLDAKLRHEMRDNITRIHKQTGITTLYVTHDQKEALSMGTSITVMRAGRTIQTGSPRELYTRPATPFLAGFIGETNLIPGIITGVEKDVAGHSITVETEIGTIVSTNSQLKEPSSGQKCMVSIRPEMLQIRIDPSSPEPTRNKLRLALDRLTYLGESEQIQLKHGSLLVRGSVFRPTSHMPEEGTLLSVGVDSSDVLLLAEETDLSSGT
ncbi:MAG: ABC transporter ATP-binding protein [Pseudomonadota bacterium]